MSETTAIAKALLSKMNLESEDELWEEAKAIPSYHVDGRILRSLMREFTTLDSAEREVAREFRQLQDAMKRQSDEFFKGNLIDATWISEHSRKLAEATAKVQETAEKIQELIYILNGPRPTGEQAKS